MGKRIYKVNVNYDNYILLFLFIIIVLLSFCIYKKYFFNTNISNNSNLHYHNNMNPHIHSSHPLFNVSSDSAYNMLRPISNPSISYNNNPTDTLMNPYSPPVNYNQSHSYRQIGYLKNSNYGNKMFPIFAKPVHLRRDKWYYYTIYDNIKLPIYSNHRKCSSEHGCDSLMNGDIVQLENMNDNFIVSTYDNHTLTYDPVI